MQGPPSPPSGQLRKGRRRREQQEAEDARAGEHVLKNLTGKRIAILPISAEPERRLIIPPFGQRTIPTSELDFYEHHSWTRQMLVTVEQLCPTPQGGSSAIISLSPMIAGYSLLGAFTSLTTWLVGYGHTAFLMLFLIAMVVTLASSFVSWRFGQHLGETWGRMRRSANIFLVVLIGVGVPLMSMISIDTHYRSMTERDVFGYGWVPLLLLLCTASTLPAALYYWFHRQKMPVLRGNFLRDIVRLDPNVQTLADAETGYSSLIDDVYGRSPSGSRSTTRRTPAAWGGLPILIVTLVFAGLWSWTLLARVEQRENEILTRRESAAAAIGKPGAVEESQDIASFMQAVPGYQEPSPDLLSLLTPTNDVVTFAFLGSYFFALNMLFRRYTRSDLSPKAYTHVCVRTITAIVVTWAVSHAPLLHSSGGPPKPIMLILAFMIGIIPETGTAVIQDVLQSTKWLGNKIPSIQEEHPLPKLHGISLYDRSQLLEVGIENVESLAHNNLVDLMLWTRIPTSRLVDFVDQAILYLHVQGPARASGEEARDAEDGARQLLAEHGIRTATDLERAYDLAKDKAPFLGLLDPPGASVQHLRVILDALTDDEWMVYLRNWRSQNLVVTPLSTVEEFIEAASRGTRSHAPSSVSAINLMTGSEVNRPTAGSVDMDLSDRMTAATSPRLDSP